MSALLCLVEHDRGKINELSFQMLTFARGMVESDADIGPLEAVLIGELAVGLADGLADYGVTRVHMVHHPLLTDYGPEAWAESVVQLMAAEESSAVLAAGSEKSSEVMAHVGARTDLPMVANCTEVTTGAAWEMTRVRWGGSLLERARLDAPVKLITVAPHVVTAEHVAGSGGGTLAKEVFEPDLPDDVARTVVSDRVTLTEGVTLTTARVVVSGGRGVGSTEGFAMLEELAGLVDGAVGCSRVVTNNGWRPHSDQVGQTGTRVAPDLYIACGISGAIQHWVGMMAAKTILAINTDAEAPMVTKADYAVVGDLHEILPAVIAEVRKIKG